MRALLKSCLVLLLLAGSPVFSRLEAADFARFKEKANKGDAVSQYLMGLEYEQGEDVPLDLKISASWFLKAAEQGYAHAQYRLAALYATGKGADLPEAFKWYLKAAQQGVAPAQFAVAQIMPTVTARKPIPLKPAAGASRRRSRRSPERNIVSATHTEYGQGVRQDKSIAAVVLIKLLNKIIPIPRTISACFMPKALG